MKFYSRLGIYLASPLALLVISTNTVMADSNNSDCKDIPNSSIAISSDANVNGSAQIQKQQNNDVASTDVNANVAVNDSHNLEERSNDEVLDNKNKQEASTQIVSTTNTPSSISQELPQLFVANYYSQDQYDNATYIYKYFTQQGWTLQAVAGMLGNMVTESGIRPDIWAQNGDGGYGIVQWTPATSMRSWCTTNGYNYTQLAGQCAYIQYQMTHNLQFYPSNQYSMNAYQYMHSTLSPYTLGLVFLANFERPANPNQPQRGQQAEYWYNYFVNQATSLPSGQHPNNKDNNSVQQTGSFTTNTGLNIRRGASLSASIAGRLSAGNSFNYDSKIEADGYLWASYITYKGTRAYVAIKSLTDGQTFGKDSNNFSFPASNHNTSNPTRPDKPADKTVISTGTVKQAGTFVTNTGLNIRRDASLSAPIAGRFSAGDSFNYDTKIKADGYLWASYITYKGTRAYVAIQSLTTGQKFGTDSNNFSFPVSGNTGQSTEQGKPVTSIRQAGSFVTNTGLNIRRGASLTAPIASRFNAGSSFNYDSKIEADGYLWASYITYKGTRAYVAIKSLENGQTFGTDSNNFSFPIPTVNDDNNKQTTSNETIANNKFNQMGSFVTNTGLNIRRGASLSAPIAGRLAIGNGFNYDSKIEADGYLWASYITYKGTRAYVAIKSLTNGQTFGTDSNNFAFVENNDNSKTVSTDTSRGEQIVEFARQQLGKPYRYGAAGPNSFDCSGLVQYVYNHCGIDLPRVTTQQEKEGYAVSLNELQPGDLLFWGPQGNSYHVAIYTGNGNMLYAPEERQVVKEIPVKSWMPSFARRVL